MSTQRKSSSPASTVRSAKARIDEASKAEMPTMPAGEHPASAAARETGQARQSICDIRIPITFSEVCSAIGHDVKPENFAATALMDLAGQVEVLSEMAEQTEFSGYEAWAFTQNVAARMKLASRVAAWFDDGGESDTLPEVAP
jgi:hypothetical protein